MQTSTLQCRHQTAGLIIIIIGLLFITIGCEKLYRTIGLTEQQTTEQLAQDRAAIEGILNTSRSQLYDIIMTIIAGTGATLSGVLAKWLKTEKKITKAIIQGVEAAEQTTVKAAIQEKATAAGVEAKLKVRVNALT